MKRRIISLFLALVMTVSLAACRDSTPSAESGVETRVFTDDAGREVILPAEITCVVPSGPLSQVILFAIAPDLFVGLASDWNDNASGIIADEYLDLPYFGQLYGSADLSVEELALAAPQVIVDIGNAKDSVVEDLDALQAQTTIPTVHIASTLETMPDTFRRLGELLGREERGEELALFCQKVYSRTMAILDEVGDNKTDALFILGEEGLNVLAKGSYHADILDLLVNNVAVVENPVSKGTGNEVTLEQIALWDPELIIFEAGSIYAEVDEMDTWKDLSAIASGSYLEIPDAPYSWMGSPPAVQRCLALIWLTTELYPEHCDYDVKSEVMEYYELFYGCTLTDEQYEALTANAGVK